MGGIKMLGLPSPPQPLPSTTGSDSEDEEPFKGGIHRAITTDPFPHDQEEGGVQVIVQEAQGS